jgi:peptidoglycan/LPS O-acetylase OafA/YrhL
LAEEAIAASAMLFWLWSLIHLSLMKNERNILIEVLRGILAWTVVAIHISKLAGWKGQVGTTSFAIGQWAVDGFIVISGYVITLLLMTKKQPYRVFAFQRFMRIFPAYAVAIVFSIVLMPIYNGHFPDRLPLETSEQHFFGWHLLTHATMLHGLVPHRILPEAPSALIPVGWSITLEWQFYLIAPLVLLYLGRFQFRGFIVLALASLVMFKGPVFHFLSNEWQGLGAFLPQKFGLFMVGIGLYLFLRAPAFLGIEWPEMPWRNNQKERKYWASLIRVGKVSYSTYLLHLPVLITLSALMPVGWTKEGRTLVLAFLGAPLILVLSILLYHFVERPGIALGRKLTRPQRAEAKNLIHAQATIDW